MTPLNIIQKTSIIKRIDFLKTELKDLTEYHDLDFKAYSQNRKARREVERIIENISNALIDIGKIILAGEAVSLPETYKEVFLNLETCGVIDAGLTQRLASIVRLRNILSHQYLDLKWDMIKDFLTQGRKDAEAFLEIVQSSKLQECGE